MFLSLDRDTVFRSIHLQAGSEAGAVITGLGNHLATGRNAILKSPPFIFLLPRPPHLKVKAATAFLLQGYRTLDDLAWPWSPLCPLPTMTESGLIPQCSWPWRGLFCWTRQKGAEELGSGVTREQASCPVAVAKALAEALSSIPTSGLGRFTTAYNSKWLQYLALDS